MVAAFNITSQTTISLSDCAQATLNCSKYEITSRFEQKEINILNYNQKDEKETLIEIRLDGGTLSCLMNQDDVCYKSYLFLDDLDHLHVYINYCDNNYVRQQSFPNIWRSKDCYVYLNDYKDDLFFSFSCNSANADL